ncbi:hypothetical protein PENSPDRAFT_246452 [Peniophora sp. CONT]|nr:hypothetical protein PENSPDRAFT_246452 [Peniophora sp. CONT]
MACQLSGDRPATVDVAAVSLLPLLSCPRCDQSAHVTRAVLTGLYHIGNPLLPHELQAMVDFNNMARSSEPLQDNSIAGPAAATQFGFVNGPSANAISHDTHAHATQGTPQSMCNPVRTLTLSNQVPIAHNTLMSVSAMRHTAQHSRLPPAAQT